MGWGRARGSELDEGRVERKERREGRRRTVAIATQAGSKSLGSSEAPDR